MFYLESKRIYQSVIDIGQNNSVILNLGSSTKSFREIDQPYIDKEIFNKLKSMGYKIIHTDIKHSEGVDLVGNILDPKFQLVVRNLNPNIIICSNLLEHIEDRVKFLTALETIVSQEAYLIVTVPYQFPYHPDPIDTLYRPSLKELKQDLSMHNLVLIKGEILNAGLLINCTSYSKFQIMLNTLKLIVRLLLPYYKYENWNKTLKNTRYAKVTIGVFRKNVQENANK